MTVLAEPNHPPFKLLTEEPNFEEEREGWKGYVEWEKYPEKKKQVAELLAKYQFPPVWASFVQFDRTGHANANNFSLQNFSSPHYRIQIQSSKAYAGNTITMLWVVTLRRSQTSAGNMCYPKRLGI